VLTASDGTLALTELAQRLGEVKLVITDILMPFMDGVQLLHAVQKLAPGLPVIASSGALGMPGQRDRTDEVRSLGVRHILLKPYSVEALLRAAHAELHKGRGPAKP
jgi:CheY-like chemotaxis protein